jgi:signal transduction histidine kinase
MRRRLNLTLLAVTVMVTLAFIIPLGAVVRIVATDRALSVADQEARTLAGVLASESSHAALQSVVGQLNADGSGRRVAVFTTGEATLGAHFAVPMTQLASARAGHAFSASYRGTTLVWVPVRLPSSTAVGVVSVPGNLLTAGVWKAWLVLAAVGVAILGLALLLSDRLGRSLVRSIEDLDTVTRRLSTGDLGARAVPAGPAEIEHMGRAVNTLAERINELLELEREQAADLSHGLRTPLTALALEADALTEPRDRQKMRAAVHDLSEAVNSVIVEVRRARPRPTPETSDITETIKARLIFWSVLAEEQDRRWTLELPEISVKVCVPAPQLVAAIDALVGNVLAYTPEGTPFRVTLSTSATQAMLVVEDEGPGFPDGPNARRGHSGGGSTGLGLDIVRRTAERAHGSMVTGAAAGGGARVEISFERAMEEAPPAGARDSGRESAPPPPLPAHI